MGTAVFNSAILEAEKRDFVELHVDVSASPLWDRDLAPVIIAQRTWSTWNIAALWSGLPATITLFAFIGVAVTSAILIIYPEPISAPVKLLQKFNSVKMPWELLEVNVYIST